MRIISLIKECRLAIIVFFYRCLPIKKKKILLWSDNFKNYGDSPKYLAEYLLNNRPKQYDIVWVLNTDVTPPSDFPKDIKIVKYFSIEYLKELHTAQYIICNTRIGTSQMWKKRRGQKYIQTWHSSIRLKKIERDAEDTLPHAYIENAKRDSSQIDLLISGCDFSTNIFRNSFWYDGLILKSGTPRCDVFFSNKNRKNEIRKKLKLGEKNLVILYAPTFRNSNKADLHGLDVPVLKQTLKNLTGSECIFLYRFHPNVNLGDDISVDGIDVTKYPDMQELILISDLLITDYSSCMFDMAIAGKICILYTPDFNNYLKDERGVYFDINSLPFPRANDNCQLMDILINFNLRDYYKNLGNFLKNVGSYEKGNACEKIVNYIENYF